MSGICAVWRKDSGPDISRTLMAVNNGLVVSAVERAQQATVAHAGVGVSARFPDSQQIHQNARLLIACDADLLNEHTLRSELGGAATSAGPAVLLAALYESCGERFVHKLRGGFAVIVCDLAERRLFAAIDGFGIKRLAWRDDGRTVSLATRANALAPVGAIPSINPRAVANVVNFSANLAPETIFKEVQRLRPGIGLHVSETETRTSRYWDMQYGLDEGAGEAQLAREMEAVVARSVIANVTTRSPAELGAFLSGGTDSSTVLGLMTRELGAPVKAFSIGFQEQPFNELEYAYIAARAFKADHHTYQVSARDCEQVLPDIVRCFDEPFGNASAVPTYFCARLAAEHGTRTLMAGDGGDELFGGNERYATERIFEIYHAVPGWIRTGLIEPAAALPLENRISRKARGYIRRANMRGVERMFSFAFLRAHVPQEVFTGDFLNELGDYTVLDIPTEHYERAPAGEHLDHLLYVDMKVTIADNDLPKVTLASELAGIRTRFPFLDPDVAGFSGRIPARFKVKGLEKRYLFKRAFRHLLPAEIIRKKKHGFGIPVSWWMKSDQRFRSLARDTLLSQRARERGYFRPTFVQELFEKHEATESPYYGDILWTMLMLELWHEQFVDQPARVVA